MLSPATRHLFWLAGWMFGLGILGIFVLRWWTGDQFLLARLTGYFMPWLLPFLLPAFLLALWFHYRWLAVLLLLPLLAVILTYAPLFSPARIKPWAAEDALKVISFNVSAQNRNIAAMADLIKEERPDILLLQEITPRQFDSLRQMLDGLYIEGDLHSAYEPELLQAVISRFSLVPLKSLKQLGQAQKVVVLTPSESITVFNVHPLRRGGWQRRYRQIADLLTREILETPGAVILGGDFNVTDRTQLYQHLTSHLANAHWEAGFGFGFSFPSLEVPLLGALRLPPLLRIDHIFYNHHFDAISARTLNDSGGSDHYPVVAVLVRRQPASASH